MLRRSTMENGVRDLRNRTAQVIDAVKSGEPSRSRSTASRSPISCPTGDECAGSQARTAVGGNHRGNSGSVCSGPSRRRPRHVVPTRWCSLAGRGSDPISEPVMVTWARLVAACRTAGIARRVKLTDALIAATPIEHGLPVVTQFKTRRAWPRVLRSESPHRLTRVGTRKSGSSGSLARESGRRSRVDFDAECRLITSIGLASASARSRRPARGTPRRCLCMV
jgi:hypothetical protein